MLLLVLEGLITSETGIAPYKHTNQQFLAARVRQGPRWCGVAIIGTAAPQSAPPDALGSLGEKPGSLWRHSKSGLGYPVQAIGGGA